MRFQTNIYLGGDPPFRVNAAYRRGLVSLIKEALSKSDIYGEYYGEPKKNKPKPFTFSAALPVERTEKGSLILRGDRIGLYFSACDSLFLTEIYNGLLSLKPEFTAFKPYEMRLKNFYLQKEVSITEREMVFKTYSPVLVRDIEEKKGKGFIDHNHKNFGDNLFFSVRNLCRNFLDKDYDLPRERLEINILKPKSVIARNYGGETGTSGIFQIKAPPEVLQLVRDAGLGAKRSQGFGMLEAIL